MKLEGQRISRVRVPFLALISISLDINNVITIIYLLISIFNKKQIQKRNRFTKEQRKEERRRGPKAIEGT